MKIYKSRVCAFFLIFLYGIPCFSIDLANAAKINNSTVERRVAFSLFFIACFIYIKKHPNKFIINYKLATCINKAKKPVLPHITHQNSSSVNPLIIPACVIPLILIFFEPEKKRFAMRYRDLTKEFLFFSSHLTNHDLVKQDPNVYDTDIDLTPKNKECAFFADQLWSINLDSIDNSRKIQYRNDIKKISYTVDFVHIESLRDKKTVLIVDGPNKLNSVLVAYNNGPWGGMSLLTNTNKTKTAVAASTSSLQHLLGTITTAILHPEDNTVVYAGLFENVLPYIAIESAFVDLQREFIWKASPFSLKKIVYLGKETYLALNDNKEIVVFWQKNNTIYIEVKKIFKFDLLEEDSFKDIAVDQTSVTATGFMPHTAFLNTTGQIFWCDLKSPGRITLYFIAQINADASICRLSLHNKEIGILFNGNQDHEYGIFKTYKIDYPAAMVKKILNFIPNSV
jgi:hypothetical protein